MARLLRYKWWLGLCLLFGLVGLGVWHAFGAWPRAPAAQKNAATRIVSLSPALTETLFAIGAGEQVVGVSDYCTLPEAARLKPKTGTSITPNYEAIVRLGPTLIVTEAAVNARPQNLERLAPTLTLPWLSLNDVLAGTRRLGKVTGKEPEAEALARRLEQRLKTLPAKGAPRVLLVLGYGGDKLDEVWFIRQNSIHGAALRAAGARNAVDHDVTGQPRMSLERVLALDPDVILVLLGEAGPSPERVRQSYQQLQPLRAIKTGRLGVIQAPEAFSNGPSILKLADRLEAELKALSAS